MEKTLDKFKIGEKGIVKTVKGEGAIRRRLLDMGITPTCEILLKQRAPLGDPLEIFLRGYSLTLRKNEANFVILEVEEK